MSSLLQLADAGFADRGVIRPLIRRIALKGAVADVRASIEALADLLNEHREPLGGDGAALLEQGVGLTGGDEQGALGRLAIDGREGHAMRENELLDGIHLVSQLLDRIDVGIRHGLFSCAGEPEGKPACDAAHRLSGGAK